MSTKLILDIAGMVTLIGGCVLYGVVTLKFKWIVSRFDQNPELTESNLFALPAPGLKTFGYVLGLLLLDCTPDWAVEYGVRKGNLPAGLSRSALLMYFSRDELRQVRRMRWVFAPWCAMVFVLVLLHALGYPSTE